MNTVGSVAQTSKRILGKGFQICSFFIYRSQTTTRPLQQVKPIPGQTFQNKRIIRKVVPGLARVYQNNRMAAFLDEGWLKIGDFNVFAWSVSGIETSVVIQNDDVLVCFDIGYSCKESIRCKHVFISHGHMDHISAVPQHAVKRELFSMPPAKYYCPPHLVETMKAVGEGYCKMNEKSKVLDKLNVIPVQTGDTIQLGSSILVRPFPTIHRVVSQGYILYKQVKKLKPEYQGLPSCEVAKFHREGHDIHDITQTPEVAFTGDTQFEVFLQPPTPDLLKVKLLIMEATYIDDDFDSVQKARDRGHTHFHEITENASLFANVENILLIHFSNKYSPDYVQYIMEKNLPASLKDKVHVATLALPQMR